MHPYPTSLRHCVSAIAKSIAIALTLLAVPNALSDDRTSPSGPIGLPIARTFSFEELGHISAGSRLAIDQLGRLTATQEGTFLVFDGRHWTNSLGTDASNYRFTRAALAPDGKMYCGGAGVWGYLEPQSDGKSLVRSLRPSTAPSWTNNGTIQHVVATRRAVAFASDSGVIHLDLESKTQFFAAVPHLSALFIIGDEIYLSSYGSGICRIDSRNARLEPVVSTPVAREHAFERVTTWDDRRVLGFNYQSNLVLFDGLTTERWPTEIDPLLGSGVDCIQVLDGGNVSIAIKGRGLYVLDIHGHVLAAYEEERFASIYDLCVSEPGVLWVSSADGISRLLYRYPVRVFDHRLGLVPFWPQVLHHHGQTLVVSSGKVFETKAEQPGYPTPMSALDIQIPDGVWYAASAFNGLLLGGRDGVYFRDDTGSLSQILSDIIGNRVVPVDTDRREFLVISTTSIAAIGWRDGRWREVAERVPGVGYPSYVVTTKPGSVWVELGLNRVARILWQNGKIEPHVRDTFPWSVPRWVNIGKVGSLVVLTVDAKERLFFDESKDDYVDAPALSSALAASPRVISRPVDDSTGAIWAPHSDGIFRLVPSGNGYLLDTESFSAVQESSIMVEVLGSDEVWVTAKNLLLRLHPESPDGPHPSPAPVIARIVDSKRNQEIFSAIDSSEHRLNRIPYESNSLDFHLFAKAYPPPRDLRFQFLLEGYSENWSVPTNDTAVRLTSLHEGDYTLKIRMLDGEWPIGETTSFSFGIAPPWYRTWPAYTCYALAVVGLAALGARLLLIQAAVRNSELEALVRARTAELDAANSQLKLSVEEAQQAAKAKSQFLANMSHEIRTPMNGVIGMSNILLDTKLSSDERQELTTTVRNSAESLLTILNDILDFSKIEAGKLSLDSVDTDLRQLVEETIDLLAPRAAEKSIELVSLIDHDFPSRMHVDPTRLRQVLLNIVGNAVKFTERGTVTVRVLHDRTERVAPHYRLCFEVIDTGTGIPYEAQSRLFQSFNQADNSTARKFGGTGLGLAICRQLVGMMGGEISFTSTPGQGSTFRFTLSLSAGDDTSLPTSSTASLKNLRVLASSGSDTLHDLLSHHAGFYDYSLRSVATLPDALNELRQANRQQSPFDALVVDLRAGAGEGSALLTDLADCLKDTATRLVVCRSINDRERELAALRDCSFVNLHMPSRECALVAALGGTRRPLDQTSRPIDLQTRADASSPPLRILVAEDNPVNRRLVSLQLRKLGYTADFATDGLEAVSAASRANYDVVLMDCQMPDLDGYDATRRLRADVRHEGLQIIAMTANALDGDRMKCIDAGMDDYLSKPLRDRELREALHRAHLRIESSRSRAATC